MSENSFNCISLCKDYFYKNAKVFFYMKVFVCKNSPKPYMVLMASNSAFLAWLD